MERKRSQATSGELRKLSGSTYQYGIAVNHVTPGTTNFVEIIRLCAIEAQRRNCENSFQAICPGQVRCKITALGGRRNTIPSMIRIVS